MSDLDALLDQLADKVAARVLAGLNGAATSTSSATPDRLLALTEAARLLGVTPRWLRDRADRLPFTRRLSRKVLRFSADGLRRYLERRS